MGDDAVATPRTCVVLLSHRLCDTTLSRLDALRQGVGTDMAVVLALTEPLGRAVAGLGLADCLVLARPDVFLPDYGQKGASRRIVPGNPDLVTLAVRRARPGHQHYWYVEYDVWFAGGTEVLTRLDAATDADLVFPLRLHSRQAAPWWHHWPSVTIPAGEAPPEAGQWHGLLCLHRASARLLDAVDAAYRRGWAGHFEAMLPTIAAASGFAVEGLGDMAHRLFGRPLLDRRSFQAPGCEPAAPDMIYHPVKSAEAERALREGRPVMKQKR